MSAVLIKMMMLMKLYSDLAKHCMGAFSLSFIGVIPLSIGVWHWAYFFHRSQPQQKHS
jgi:hypothetical protein